VNVAVKITRHPDKIALLGAPTSAAALAPGNERAPEALRAAGLIERLRGAGYDVSDHGDDPVQLSQPDDESPRARNLPRIVKSLEALRPRVEAAVKSGAVPIILSGDCSIALATVAGVRRYFHSVSVIYLDRDADLNIPATTPSGCVDGMVVAHLTGRGAAELVRFWGEPPLVRDPDVALFGVDRFDPPEEELLRVAPIRSFPASEVKKRGAAATAKLALERIHASRNEFILHFDVDVIENFPATNYPGAGGLTLDQLREAMEVFVADKHLAAIDVSAYNPEKDPDGSGAKQIVDLLVAALTARREKLAVPAASEVGIAAAASASPAGHTGDSGKASASVASGPAAVAAGEAWSSDSLDSPDDSAGAASGDESGNDEASSGGSGEAENEATSLGEDGDSTDVVESQDEASSNESKP
jgi:arginase